MSSVIVFLSLLFVAGHVTASDSVDITEDKVGNHFRRLLQDAPGRVLGRYGNELQKESLRKHLQSLDPTQWSQFTPSPMTEEPSCYVELQVTQRMPGRCTKLGGKIPACQSNEIVTIDYGSCE